MRGRVALLLSMAMAGVSTAAENGYTRVDASEYTKPSKMVAVDDGRKLNLHCTGSGMPTVLFESGLGDNTRLGTCPA